ncbi:MAG: PDZ domain-containing protein [Acidobacteriota bacterium]
MLLLRFALIAGLVVCPLVIPDARAQSPAAPSAAPSGSYLGVWIWQIDMARARELKLPSPTGLEVTLVREGSPADAAGLKVGDVLATYNGQRVEGIDQFSRLVGETPVGRAVRIEFYRNGMLQNATAKVGSISQAERPGPIPVPRGDSGMPDIPHSLLTWRSPLLGVDAEPVEGQLAAYFGVTQGVLVRTVAQNSAAEKAGVKAGDVIIRVGRFPVATPAETTLRLRTAKPPSASITVMRDHKEITLTVTLDVERGGSIGQTLIGQLP